MSRKGPAAKRRLPPDPRHNSVLVNQLINKVMVHGKRAKAERIVYDAFDILGQRAGGDPVGSFRKAVDNIKPQLEVKPRRVGGATYQVPIEVRSGRGTALALRWLTAYTRLRREPTMAQRLAGELLDAGNNTGAAVKRREDTHKMAEANKAFAHYRW
jgi:small subunit ribosomal protein S7